MCPRTNKIKVCVPIVFVSRCQALARERTFYCFVRVTATDDIYRQIDKSYLRLKVKLNTFTNKLIEKNRSIERAKVMNYLYNNQLCGIENRYM